MHIVILDGGSTNPGDVSWAPLRALGSVTVYDSTKPEEIVERAKDAECSAKCAGKDRLLLCFFDITSEYR